MIKAIKRLFAPKPLVLGNGKHVKPPMPIAPFVIFALVIVGYISVKVTGFSFATIVKRGKEFFVILKAMFPPDWGYIGHVMEPLLDTIKMSFLGSFAGAALAVPFAVLSSSNIAKSKVLYHITRFLLSLVRTLPTLIIALIATYVFNIGTLAGTLAIGIFTFAIVAKMLYEQIETVDMAAFEAMESLGASKVQAFMTAVVPQILPSYLSICLYSLEINVRYAAILGYVGAGGIGLLLDEKLKLRGYDKASMVIVMLFVTVVCIESISRYLRKRLTQ